MNLEELKVEAESAMKTASKFGHSMTKVLNYINALEAKVAEREWQPIETAPKDGARILATSLGCVVHIHYWNSTANDWMIDFADGVGWQPTKWMPIPSPNVDPTPPTQEASNDR